MTIHSTGLDGVRIVTGNSIHELIRQLLSSVSEGLDCYVDARNTSTIIGILMPDKMIELKSKGLKLRCVTEVTKDNLSFCKETMKYFDLYHIPLLNGSFMILDGKEYLGFLMDNKDEETLLYVRIPSFVNGQRFLFNGVIGNAVPAIQRIREIGRGIDAEFMETIRDPHRVKTLLFDLINSAIYEISILFSTRNSFLVAEREGILDALGPASARGIKVRILVMKDDIMQETSVAKLKVAHQDIHVNYLQQFMPSKITTFIVDQNKSLVMEVNDDTKETLHEAVGLATYSNSESTVFSNSSLFESLWIQSELDKQSKTKQVYFQMFKGFKLKDEVYNRRWSFERNEKTAQE